MTDLARLQQLVATTDAVPDADLLARFVTDRDGPAFAALVRRHGPMVLSVCRRVLRHRQDAEDAFQATFLVLARRAETITLRSPLGSWLYGVAYRTALSARRAASVRRDRESRAAEMKPDEQIPDHGLTAELREALDRELAALPDTYRAAVVVCDLEGLHRRDAALRLGWTEGTLSSRLARARALLARRLARYGLAVPTVGLAAVAGPVAVAHALAEPTVRLGTLVAVGEAVVAAPVAALMEGTMKTMLLLKLKALAASAVVGCAVAATALAGWRADTAGTAEPAQPNTPKAAEAPRRAAQKPDNEPRAAAPKSDKERIAELERERDRLLKQVAELAARLDRVEAERRAAAPEKRKPSASAIEDAEKLAAEKLARDIAQAEKLARDAVQAEKLAAEKLARDIAQAEKLAREAAALAEKRARAAQEAAQAAERRAQEKIKAAQDAAQTQKQAKESHEPAPQRDPAPKVPSDRRPAGPALKSTEPLTQRDLVPAAKSAVRVYAVGDLAGDEKEGEALAKVVRATVEPKSWGTDAGVEYLPGRKVLVVRQTAKAHDEVNELLALLRSQKAPAGK